MYTKLFYMSTCIGAICAFFIVGGRRSGVLEWLQARSPRWLPWGCNFCLGFWLSLIFVAILYFNEPVTLTPFLVIIISTAINHALTK